MRLDKDEMAFLRKGGRLSIQILEGQFVIRAAEDKVSTVGKGPVGECSKSKGRVSINTAQILQRQEFVMEKATNGTASG